MYFIGDCFYLLVYYIIGYRREVVRSNLLIAFPEKTEEERKQISKQFYHNFIDTFIETIKLLSISDKEFTKRFSGNYELLVNLHATGKSAQFHSGHFFNWEYINWGVAINSPYTFLGVYAPLDSKAFNRIMIKLRGRYHTVLLASNTFKTTFHLYAKSQYALGLAADQSAPPEKSFWIPFFGKLAPFVMGPERGAVINNTAIVFVHFYKIKRGYYQADFELITTEPAKFERGQLTKMYVEYLENCIRKKPDNYLWSHRKWKHEFQEQFRNNLLG